MRQQIAFGIGSLLQFLELVLPVEGDTGRHHIALFRGLDRRLQHGVDAELAVIGQHSSSTADFICCERVCTTSVRSVFC